MEATDYMVNVLLGLVFVVLAGALAYVGAYLWSRHLDRKEAERREAEEAAEEQAQALKAGGGGGPDPVR